MAHREGFLFYRSFYEAIHSLPKRDRLLAYEAVLEYALNEAEPELTGAPAAIFLLIRPNLDASRRKADSGRRGGQARSKSEADGKQSAGRGEAIKDKGLRIKDEGQGMKDGGGETGARGRFTPPTLAEVAEYAAQRGSPVDPQQFLDFYASKGWMVGKTPMKDWKAACRNAEKWERWTRPTASERPSHNPFLDLLEREGES